MNYQIKILDERDQATQVLNLEIIKGVGTISS